MRTLKPLKPTETASVAMAVFPKEVVTVPAIKSQATRRTAAKKAVVAKPASEMLDTRMEKTSKKSIDEPTVIKPVEKDVFAKAFANNDAKKAVKKIEGTKKPKLVRDSFTMPKVEYVVLEALKQRAARLKRSVKKSELLRAGIKELAAMQDAAFLTALEQVPATKTARLASEK